MPRGRRCPALCPPFSAVQSVTTLSSPCPTSCLPDALLLPLVGWCVARAARCAAARCAAVCCPLAPDREHLPGGPFARAPRRARALHPAVRLCLCAVPELTRPPPCVRSARNRARLSVVARKHLLGTCQDTPAFHRRVRRAFRAAPSRAPAYRRVQQPARSLWAAIVASRLATACRMCPSGAVFAGGACPAACVT